MKKDVHLMFKIPVLHEKYEMLIANKNTVIYDICYLGFNYFLLEFKGSQTSRNRFGLLTRHCKQVSLVSVLHNMQNV